jgi:hypothetical protein
MMLALVGSILSLILLSRWQDKQLRATGYELRAGGKSGGV